MALEQKYASKDLIPANRAELYVERDGAFVLDVAGRDERDAKLDEMRKHNIELNKKLVEVGRRFEGIDPEAVRKLAAEKQALEEAAALKAGEFDKVLLARLAVSKAEQDKVLAAEKLEKAALHAELVSVRIDQVVANEATKRGLRPTALPDITARAKNTFRLVNGVPQAMENDGQTVRVGKDGLTPLTMAEWLDAQVSEAPHLFEGNAGGGAAGNITGGGASGRAVMGRNPFKRDAGWNVTEQMALMKTDPQLAARLKAAA